MIAVFPTIYQDELLYSVFARYYEKSGYMTCRSVVEDLYRRNTITFDAEYINPLSNEVCKLLIKQGSMDEVIMKHTMFPYYTRFYPKEKRDRIYQMLVSETKKCSDLLKHAYDTERFMRFCPVCAREDREKYGETYWHRTHQIPDIKICPIHKCVLFNSSLQMEGSMVSELATAENLVNDDVDVKKDFDDEIRLSEYLYDLLQMDIDMKSDILVGDFLNSRLDGTCYKSPRGQQRNIALFTSDFNKFYKNTNPNIQRDIPQMQKIFTNKRYNTFEIYLIANFLKITVREIVAMVMPQKSQQQLFDEQVFQLHNKGLNYVEIAKQLNASYDVVKLIGRKKYKTANKRKGHNRGGVKKKDWDKIDKEMLPVIKDVIHNLQEQVGRPVKLSVNMIEKQLNLPSRYITHLPQCEREIQKHLESQESYWAREAIWAVQDILSKGEKLQWVTIRRMTNMRKEDLQGCMEEVRKKTNQYTYDLLMALAFDK